MSDAHSRIGPRSSVCARFGASAPSNAPEPTSLAGPAIPIDALTPRPTPESQPERLQRMQSDLALVVAKAKFCHPDAGIEPPHLKMLESIFSPSWLFNTAKDQPPREMKGGADLLTRTPDKLGAPGSTPESRLREAMLAEKGPLEPADVLKLSLQVNGNDYFLASLAAHNVLKDACSTERRLHAKQAMDPAVAAQDLAIIGRLANLRAPDGPNSTEKMGPWYHVFGLATLDAGSKWIAGEHSHLIDRLASGVEHARFLNQKTWDRIGGLITTLGFHSAPSEKLAHWLERRHPFEGADPEKAAIDRMAVNAFSTADRQQEDRA